MQPDLNRAPIAHAESGLVWQFINDRVADVSAITAKTGIVEAITASNRSHARMSDEALAARITEIERDRETVGSDWLAEDLLSSQTSRWLQQQRTENSRLLKVVVADETEATVAATDRPLHYTQAKSELLASSRPRSGTCECDRGTIR